MTMESLVVLIWATVSNPHVYHTDIRRYEYSCSVMEDEINAWLEYTSDFLIGDFLCFPLT